MSDRAETYIYESPDGGDTVYRRKFGSDLMSREIHKISERRQAQIEELRAQKLWDDIRQAAKTDPALQEMLDRIVVYHQLKNSP